jgi:cytochrome o ubiquinol oxidase operon protein cyoD
MSDKHIGGAARGSYGSYSVGFALALVLTAVPFILVMTSAMSRTALLVTIGAFAVVQIGVHLVYFLHLNRSSEQRWNLVVFAYTLVILAILVGASVWIMFHLNYTMMPR